MIAKKRMPLLVGFVLVLTGLACGPLVDTGPTVERADPTPEERADPTPLPPPETGPRPTELTPDQIDEIVAASVQIVAAENVGGDLRPLWSGSGTVISPDGEILTNCHVACDAPVIVILVTETPDQPPVARYIAEIQFADPAADLALLQVVSDMDGSPVEGDIPFLEVGNSDQLRLGDPVRVFGYPSVGEATITFTSGSVSGFVSRGEERFSIKTDADIASGNSGGTAVDLNGRLVGVPTLVNPDIRDGVTIGGIGVLRPINLLTSLREQPAEPGGAGAGFSGVDPDPYEPNNDFAEAFGPIESGEVYEGYITYERDTDFFYFDTDTTQPVTLELSNIPAGVDYQLYIGDAENLLDYSEGTGSTETITFTPPRAGRYYVLVASDAGGNAEVPYRFVATFDGGSSAGTTGITITGRTVDGNTGRPFVGGQFGIIDPAFSCRDAFSGASVNLEVILLSTTTNSQGVFRLTGVPDDAFYSAFFLFEGDYVCEDDWLEVPPDAIDSDLGEIDISF
jgi:S1-C subfamily serine protease